MSFFQSRRFWFGLLVVFLLMYAALAYMNWDWLRQVMGTEDSNSATIRNLLGGAAALAGIWFGARRLSLTFSQTQAVQQQANATQRQADVAEQSQLNDRFDTGAGLLNSDVLNERLNGISMLEQIAKEDAEQYHILVMTVLTAFVRNPLGSPESTLSGPFREDVQAAMAVIGGRSKSEVQIEEDGKFKLNLRSADLRRIWLKNANLSGANLDEADLSEAILIGADLTDVCMWGTNLTKALFADPPEGKEPVTERDPAQGLIQETLNDACADPQNPPRQLNGIPDAKTGKPLCWCSGPCW